MSSTATPQNTDGLTPNPVVERFVAVQDLIRQLDPYYAR
jgi:hypothetical protein